MKKILFFATALSVAVTSLSPIAFAANKFGLEDSKAVDVDIKVESKLNGTEYSDHTGDKPLIADVKDPDATVTFATKATLDMSNVATVWNEYIEKGLAVLQNAIPTATKADVLNAVKLDGSFTITVTADSNVTPVANEGTYNLVWDENTTKFFDQGEVTVEGNTYTVPMTFKNTSGINAELDAFLNGDSKLLSVEFATVTMKGVQAEAYAINAEFDGSVKIDVPSDSDMTVSFSGEDDQYVKLAQIVVSTAKPETKPVEAEVPTPAPVDGTEVILGEKISTSIPEDTDDSTNYGDYKDKEIAGIKVEVSKSNGSAATYGTDYVAKLEIDGDTYYLAEEEELTSL